MGVQTLYAKASALVKKSAPSANYSTGTVETLFDPIDLNTEAHLLVSFSELPSSLWYNTITSIKAYAYLSLISPSNYCAASVDALGGTFDEKTITYSTRPSVYSSGQIGDAIRSSGYSGVTVTDVRLLRYGAQISSFYGNGATVVTSRGGNKPYIEVYYDDTAVKPTVISPAPTSGYIPKHKANTFSWRVGSSGLCYASISQASATFRWRTGEGAAATEIACGTATSCTVPADTFATNSIQWQVEITANSGDKVSTAWYTLSTAEVTSSAVIDRPKNTMLDGAKDNTFSWRHVISTGTAQTAAELQYSTDRSTWSALASVDGAANSVIISAGTFPAGSCYWRVRTFNTDNVAGAWSESAEIIVIDAPGAPVVSVTSGSSPRAEIVWQADGQQAYEIRIGDVYASGEMFGGARTFKYPNYLDDGAYIAMVRVSNSYGLWSAWGSCPFTVANAGGGVIVLNASASHVAELTWNNAGYDVYYVLRDGVPIAKVTGTVYVDNFSVGAHSYQVRGTYTASGDYGLSNEVTAEVSCDTVYISPYPDAAWQRLGLADTADRQTSESLGRSVEYIELAGSPYPTAELTPFRSASMSCVCAFVDKAGALALEALSGAAVCIKDRWGNMVIGILDELSKLSTRFYISYSFTVRRVSYVEEVAYDSDV